MRPPRVTSLANIHFAVMRILVIGGTGFIGTFVVEQLARIGHEVVVFHRRSAPRLLPSGVRPLEGDRRQIHHQRDELRRALPDVVIDMILSSGAQATAVMDTFRGFAKRIVAVSSADVYRACAVLHRLDTGPLEPLPLTETSELRTVAPYPPAVLERVKDVFAWVDDEYDKVPVERVVLGDPDLPGTVVRLPMVYGPGDPMHRLHPIIKRVDDGRKVLVFADAVATWRSPRGYVENVAAAIALAATDERAAGRTYNVAEEPAFSEREWAELVAGHAGWSGDVVIVPFAAAPSHIQNPGNLSQDWVVSSARIRNDLGYREPVPLAIALARTIAWERANPPVVVDPRGFDYDAEDAATTMER
jgi:nucleoside-diphosphate-sugar epimerase